VRHLVLGMPGAPRPTAGRPQSPLDLSTVWCKAVSVALIAIHFFELNIVFQDGAGQTPAIAGEPR